MNGVRGRSTDFRPMFCCVFVLVGGKLNLMRPDLQEIRSAPDLRVLDGVASWCGGLHGSMSLSEALGALGSGLGACASAISRHYHRSEVEPRKVAQFSLDGMPRFTGGYCHDVLDYQLGRARAGTVWFLSEFIDDPSWLPSRRLDGWIDAGGVREIAVIPMSVSRHTVDYVEFHFRHVLGTASRHEIEALVPTIERSWIGRKPGLVAMALANGRTPVARNLDREHRLKIEQPLLGMSNPARLSRAEFRVCLLLSRGLSVKAVSDELSLSENTVRSHLRSIYSKTETSSLPELLYLILAVGTENETEEQVRVRA